MASQVGLQPMTPREVRVASGLSLNRFAIRAGTTRSTLRLYEATDGQGVCDDTRERLAPHYERLREQLLTDYASAS